MKNQENIRMYQNPVLEVLSISSPRMMITYHLIVISVFLYAAYSVAHLSISAIGTVFLLGLLFWSFGEYVLHRWLFHFINDTPWVQKFHHAVHGHHHEHPRDHKRLFMPPVPASILILIIFSFFYLFIRSYAWAFMPGFEFGYLLYSFMHYSMHTRKAPPMLKNLWLHHAIHHYQDQHAAFGVSSMFWDRIFGTMPAEKKNGKSGVTS